ncbi:MAG: NCS2 family permease [Succinivibrio dextrinosolvens]|uniref:Putative MFS transporter, AGZA family, xanthine/uracil permease n=1 Tax=Succinivibrio dextrinosolvens TaxID=83771 RepID=A0A662Z8P5_9GAMM|nr:MULTISPECIES: NCS2 family permease [Succinivibrio]MBQ9221299.1 NCS2 family permease [Succinivibrio sp.]MDY6415624.1 NCS2 family permease [Succinivibrio dextrinosolvens]MDY6420227.1 NCS2 family permease [Succinivibrio dextrinosolvens]MDY6465442.1 NCS2 family permease [Succinivibrio dextrinosolvens]SFJ84263.1 putative MFS transporter, AGZA family, xanthine/uracil permease [Succinivibrio dextrinosolvens]
MLSSTSQFLNRLFKIEQKGSSVSTELLAGLTTFVAMAYIIFVNPSILEASGIPREAAIAATLWSAGLCSIAMGLFSNLPIGVAPGMGINAFFAFYVCGTMGLSWQTALGAVFVSGVVFLILTITKLRILIIKAVPDSIKAAVVVGIGMFLAIIGFSSAGIVVKSDATMVTLGHIGDGKVFLSIIGMLLISVLLAYKIKGALIYGILAVTVLGMIFGLTPAPTSVSDVFSFNIPSFADTFMQMDVMGAINYGLVTVIFTFTVVELFDNICTLIGVTKDAGLMDKKGNVAGMEKALLTDSVGTMASAVLGTCTVTSYVESTTGIKEGGRTGLTAVVVGLGFFLAFVFAPLAGLIPAFATAPAIIIVGSMMMRNIKDINFSDITESIPAFLTIAMMPLSYSIGNGFGFGFISYCLIKTFTGHIKEISPVMWLISIMFIVSFYMHGV